MEFLALPATERAMYRSVWERLVAARDILLVSPKRPDGDSLGSICGLSAALRQRAQSATLYCPDPVPPTFATMPGIHDLRVGPQAIAGRTFDVIVICDAGDLAYTGVAANLPTWRTPGSTVIVLDHHVTNTAYGDVNCVVPTASSTTEVITRMLVANEVPILPTTATCLLFGLVTDTDGFTNPATTPAALAAAARLTSAGARIGPILRHVYRNKPVDALILWGRALERLTVDHWGIATTVLIPEDFTACRDGVERSEGLSNFLQAVIPARAILVLKDDGSGTVRGSFRTQRDDVDVGRLAALLGGGGHRKASGFGIPGRIERNGDDWQVVV
ncbi:DHH family phosphoesterase [Candidatus Uhrbacteria bacterium]|nr:DHH family phosphoesterase [Candidatus Uhrbacteria bacterium]